MPENLNQWVISVTLEDESAPVLHMISVKQGHTAQQVAEGFVEVMREELPENAHIFVFPADVFVEMLKDRGDESSQRLADQVVEAFKAQPIVLNPNAEMHDDQGIPRNGQEAG